MRSEAELFRHDSEESQRLVENNSKKYNWFFRASEYIYLDDMLVTLRARVSVAWDIPHTTATHYIHNNQFDRKLAEDILR